MDEESETIEISIHLNNEKVVQRKVEKQYIPNCMELFDYFRIKES